MYRILFHIIFFFISNILINSVALGFSNQHSGKLVSCSSAKHVKKGKVCVISFKNKHKHLKKGSVVLVYNKRGYWHSSGVVHARRGSKVVVIFKELLVPPHRNSIFRLSPHSDDFEWQNSFSKSFF